MFVENVSLKWARKSKLRETESDSKQMEWFTCNGIKQYPC